MLVRSAHVHHGSLYRCSSCMLYRHVPAWVLTAPGNSSRERPSCPTSRLSPRWRLFKLRSSIHTLADSMERGGGCFCRGAGEEDKSALGMMPQSYPCLMRVVNLLTLVVAKPWLLQAPFGGPSFLVDLVTAEHGGEFFYCNASKVPPPVLPLPSP